MFRFDIIYCFLLLIPVGCNKNSRVVQYEVEREPEKVLTTEVLRDQFDPLPFLWTVPKEWEDAENDQFSTMAWTAGSKNDSARITVSGLSAASGLEAQIVRWRGQLKLPEMEVAEVMKSVEDVTLKGATGKFCEFTNDTETILGMIVPHQTKLWIIKYRSSKALAEKQRTVFRGFCESFKVE